MGEVYEQVLGDGSRVLHHEGPVPVQGAVDLTMHMGEGKKALAETCMGDNLGKALQYILRYVLRCILRYILWYILWYIRQLILHFIKQDISAVILFLQGSWR